MPSQLGYNGHSQKESCLALGHPEATPFFAEKGKKSEQRINGTHSSDDEIIKLFGSQSYPTTIRSEPQQKS